MIDVEVPGEDVLAEVQRLVRHLIAMNEILRDRDHASIRLVMNPDRMVIKEAQRTFTYLNLYGYLTDAVIVNRVFPDELAGGYFGEWHERQRRAAGRGARRVRARAGADAPVTSTRRSSARGCSTASATSCSSRVPTRPRSCIPSSPTSSSSENGTATLRIRVPFGERGEIGLKKVGPELIVSVGPRKRTIILPAALAAPQPDRREAGTTARSR